MSNKATGTTTNSCVNNVTTGCSIQGTCYSEGATNAQSQCQWCNSSASKTTWSNKSSGTACDDGKSCTDSVCNSSGSCTQGTIVSPNCLIGGVCYGKFAENPLDECSWCNSAVSPTKWSENPFCEFCQQGKFCFDGEDCGLDGFCKNNSCLCF